MSQGALNRNALTLWQKTLGQWLTAERDDLTSRQWLLLLTVYLEDGPHSIKSFAARYHIPKAALCRAIDQLEVLGYVKRKRLEEDKRQVILQRTIKGSVFLSEFSDALVAAARG